MSQNCRLQAFEAVIMLKTIDNLGQIKKISQIGNWNILSRNHSQVHNMTVPDEIISV